MSQKSGLLCRVVYAMPYGTIWQTRYLCLPIAVILSTVALLQLEVALHARVFYFVLGILAWTFLEYVLHRFVLHYRASSDFGVAIVRRLHAYHHDDPKDQKQVCLPLFLLGPFWLAIFAAVVALGGNHHGSLAFVSGLALMMVVYDITHYSAHYMPPTNRILRAIKSHHMAHHYGDHHKKFGVTSGFWDRIFGTHR